MAKKTTNIVRRFQDKNIKIFALGGLDEVGKNMYCVEVDDELIVIDSGIMFPDSNYGVDYIIPDYTYLKENEDKIVGLFITHGHEDHIGGIPYLLRKVNIPKVYANGIAITLIKNKLSEHRNINANIVEFGDDSIYKFKRSEEHTSELQSRPHLVCRLLLEKKNNKKNKHRHRLNHQCPPIHAHYRIIPTV